MTHMMVLTVGPIKYQSHLFTYSEINRETIKNDLNKINKKKKE